MPPYYDSMLVKLIVHGENRADAIAKMQSALGEVIIEGIDTNVDYQFEILKDPDYQAGKIDIEFLNTQDVYKRQGGIADGRGIAAAFMLGAKAVQMGTCFVVTRESQVHENYKNCIVKAKDIDTKVTGRTTGHPVRALRNQMTKEYLKKEAEGVPFEELELLTLGGLRRAVVDGDVTTGSVMAGQSAGLVKEQMTCEQLIQKLVKETDELLKGTGIYE